MCDILNISIKDIIPTEEEVLQEQGIKSINAASDVLLKDIKSAINILNTKSKPVAIVKKCSKSDFSNIYIGAGNNAEDSILPSIIDKANSLYLFAATIGEVITNEINNHFQQNEFPTGSFIDCGASLATDNIANLLQNQLEIHFTTLSYSPGYCGWHVSGQEKLFNALKPYRIGIELNDSYLMTPLKSISGVLVSGESEIHNFNNNYSFCTDCTSYNCKIRMKSIIN